MIGHSCKASVSSVIVNYNAEQLLSDAVGAALPQVQEVIVVDNASSDSSIEECVRRFEGDRRLKIILINPAINYKILL